MSQNDLNVSLSLVDKIRIITLREEINELEYLVDELEINLEWQDNRIKRAEDLLKAFSKIKLKLENNIDLLISETNKLKRIVKSQQDTIELYAKELTLINIDLESIDTWQEKTLRIIKDFPKVTKDQEILYLDRLFSNYLNSHLAQL